MKLGVTMEYNFDNKEYRISVSGSLVAIKEDWCDALKEFRWYQRQIDKEID